jgi:hypothetical protein
MKYLSFFSTNLNFVEEHHVVIILILALVFNFRPFLEHLHILRIANYTELYRDMYNCSEKGLYRVFPGNSI